MMPCDEADSAHGRSGGLPLTQVVSAACKVLASLAAHAKSAAVSLTASAQNYLAALRQSSNGLSAYCSRRAIAPPIFCILCMSSCGAQCPHRCNADASFGALQLVDAASAGSCSYWGTCCAMALRQ